MSPTELRPSIVVSFSTMDSSRGFCRGGGESDGVGEVKGGSIDATDTLAENLPWPLLHSTVPVTGSIERKAGGATYMYVCSRGLLSVFLLLLFLLFLPALLLRYIHTK